MGQSKKVLKSALFLSAGQLLIKMTDLFAMIIMARFLMPEDFGIATLAVTTLTITRSITELQVGQALVRKTELDPYDIDRAFTISCLRGLLISLLLIGASFPLTAIYDDPRVGEVVRVIALAPLFNGFTSPRMVLFARAINYLPQAKSQIGGKLASFATSVVLAMIYQSYWAIVLGQVSFALFSMLYTHWVAPYRPRLYLRGSSEILRFAGWITASQMIGALNVQGDKLFLGAILGPTKLGYYAIAQNVSDTMGHGLASPLLNPIFSGLSRFHEEKERLQSALLRGQQYLALVLFPIGAGLGAMADPVIEVVMGANWVTTAELLIWLAPSAALQTLSVPAQAAVYATGQTKLWTLRAGIILVFRFIPVIIAAYLGGLLAATITHVMSGIILIAVNFFLIRTTIGLSIRRQIASIIRPTLGAITTFLAFYIYQTIYFLPDKALSQIGYFVLSALIGIIVYLSTLLISWQLTGRPNGAEREILTKLRSHLTYFDSSHE